MILFLEIYLLIGCALMLWLQWDIKNDPSYIAELTMMSSDQDVADFVDIETGNLAWAAIIVGVLASPIGVVYTFIKEVTK